MHPRLARHCVLILALLASPSALGGWQGSGEATLIHDDNLTNNRESRPPHSDTILQLATRLGHAWRLDRAQQLSLSGALRSQIYRNYGALSAAQVEAQARYRYRWGPGFFDPVLEFRGSAARHESEGGLRDRWILRSAASARLPMTTRLALRVQLEGRGEHSREDVWDTEQYRLDVDLDWRATQRLQVYLVAGVATGDIVSTGPLTPAAGAATRAAVLDDTFAPGESSYRLEADSWSVGLGANWRLNRAMSVDGLLRQTHSQTELDWRYRRTQAFISLLYRF